MIKFYILYDTSLFFKFAENCTLYYPYVTFDSINNGILTAILSEYFNISLNQRISAYNLSSHTNVGHTVRLFLFA